MFIFIYIFTVCVFAQNNEVLDSLVKKSKIPESTLGLWIQGGERSYSLNGNKQFLPASLSKIPTAGAALETLGLEHKYTTNIYMTGKIIGTTLNGDLYLQGGGDPGLVSESYWSLVNQLKRTGIRKINGQLYVDDFLYDDNSYSNGRQNRRVDRAYDAPVSALSFNWNSVNVFVRPGDKKNDPARVFLDPENEHVQLVNKCKTADKTNIQIDRDSKKNTDVIIVSGTMSIHETEKVVYKSITNPELWAGSNFKAFMNRDGIQYIGGVEKKRTPQDAKWLVSHESKPLVEIIADMSKFSNNFVAEMITKSMSGKKPATMDDGIGKIHKWIEGIGISSSEYVFVSPSGFSNENKLTPKDLAKILNQLNSNFKISSEFKASLPLSGVDGTLKSRLKDMTSAVRAKTGYLAGAVGLAGYFYKNGKEYIFVFMYNGPTQHDAKAKDLFDDLIRNW